MAYALDWLDTWKSLEYSESKSLNEERIRKKLLTVRRFLAIDMFNVLWSLFLIIFQVGENVQSGVYTLMSQHALYFVILSIIFIIFLANFVILLPKYSKLKLIIEKRKPK